MEIKGKLNQAHPIETPHAVYHPWSDGYAVGYRVEFRDGRADEFIYLNPSMEEEGDSPNVFLYQGAAGEAALDAPACEHHFVVGLGGVAPGAEPVEPAYPESVIVNVPVDEGGNYGKSWAKVLTGVDRSKQDGYAFEGTFLRLGEKAELPVGTLILNVDRLANSRRELGVNVYLYRVTPVTPDTPDGYSRIYKKTIHEQMRSWALAVRDEIADILASDRSGGSPPPRP